MARKILTTLVLMLFMAGFCHAATITIVADEWCPYNCVPGDALPGYMIEAAQGILGAAGHEVKYVTVDDWDQAVEDARAGKYDAIVGAARNDAPDFIFPSEEMGHILNHFYVMKGDPWRFGGMASLEGRKVAALSGYAYSDELDAWLPGNGIMFSSLEEAMEALFDGDVDTVVEGHYVMMLYAMNSYILDQIESAGPLSDDPEQVFVAFSPATSNAREYADMLTAGLKAMKADGSWNALMRKYGIE